MGGSSGAWGSQVWTASLTSTGLPGTGCLPTVKGVPSRHLGAAHRKAWGWLYPELGVLHVSPWCQVHLRRVCTEDHHPGFQGQAPCLEFPTQTHCVWTLGKEGGEEPSLEGAVRGGAHF